MGMVKPLEILQGGKLKETRLPSCDPQKSPDTPGSPEGNTEGPGTASSEPLRLTPCVWAGRSRHCSRVMGGTRASRATHLSAHAQQQEKPLQ